MAAEVTGYHRANEDIEGAGIFALSATPRKLRFYLSSDMSEAFPPAAVVSTESVFSVAKRCR